MQAFERISHSLTGKCLLETLCPLANTHYPFVLFRRITSLRKYRALIIVTFSRSTRQDQGRKEKTERLTFWSQMFEFVRKCTFSVW